METEGSIEGVGQAAKTDAVPDGRADVDSSRATAGTDSQPASAADERLAASLARIEKSLDQIVDHLHHTHRVDQIREFSLSDLAGSLCVVISAVCIIGGVLSLLRVDTRSALAWATVAFLGAIAMQGLSLALFRLSRRK